MAKIYEELDDRLCQFIMNQKMCFVGSAPLAGNGLVNISPKGMDGLRILDSKTVAYLDLTGSGIESVAHVKENGRFVIMFCSFDTSPMILRLHGRAEVIERANEEWQQIRPLFAESRMARAIIKVSVSRISDSCGWGVPLYDYVGEREQFPRVAEQRSPEDIRASQLRNNMTSIDGLPGLSKPSV